MYKKILYVLLIVLILGLVISTLSLLDFNQINRGENRRISIKYQAEREYPAEQAVIMAGIENSGELLETVFAENNQQMRMLTDKLQELGLEFETTNFEVYPYTETVEKEQINLYRVINQVEVKTDKLEEMGSYLQAMINAGANQILSINYQLKDLKKAREEVTADALSGIKEKVLFISTKLGSDNYKLLSMNINDQYQGYSLSNYAGRGAAINETALPSITPQGIKVIVNINAEYAI